MIQNHQVSTQIKSFAETKMFYINYIQIILSLMITSTILLASLINLFEKYLPSFVVQTLRYGKFADSHEKSILTVQVPKSWFKHFYLYSSVLTTSALYFCVNNYVYGNPLPNWIYNVLDCSMGSIREPSVNPSRILLALTLLTMQCLRRLYDTHYVSVFGKQAKIHLVHYIIGFFHYSACVLTILGEAPNFSQLFPIKIVLKLSDLSMMDLCVVYIFLWAWYHQYQVTHILANLRKDSKGNVVTNAYKLPKGDWFDAVSSPHNFAEIVMYTCLTFILWPNFTWWFVYTWVICNQVETAILSHRWYQEKFDDLPTKRKIIIPLIY